MNKLICFIFLSTFLLACNKNNDKLPAISNVESIRPIIDTIFIMSEAGNIEETEIVEYQYDKPTDLFWAKAIYKDLAGNEIRSYIRVLDSASRLPLKEYPVDEFGDTDDYTLFEYDPNSLLLLNKKVYSKTIAPENLINEYSFKYKDEVLISKTEKIYSLDSSYKNIDGNKLIEETTFRFLPNGKYRNKGNIETFYRIEKNIVYLTKEMIERNNIKNNKVGDIYYTEKTIFDRNSNPISYSSTDPSAGSEHRYSNEYYDTKLDTKGRLSELIPYSNAEKDSISQDALMWKFFYNNDGLIEKVEEYMHNSKTNKFDLIHGRDRYQYFNIIPELAYLSEDAFVSEHFCQHRQVYSKYEKNIEKFDKHTRIVIYKAATMDGGFPKENLEGKITKKVITTFEIINK